MRDIFSRDQFGLGLSDVITVMRMEVDRGPYGDRRWLDDPRGGHGRLAQAQANVFLGALRAGEVVLPQQASTDIRRLANTTESALLFYEAIKVLVDEPFVDTFTKKWGTQAEQYARVARRRFARLVVGAPDYEAAADAAGLPSAHLPKPPMEVYSKMRGQTLALFLWEVGEVENAVLAGASNAERISALTGVSPVDAVSVRKHPVHDVPSTVDTSANAALLWELVAGNRSLRDAVLTHLDFQGPGAPDPDLLALRSAIAAIDQKPGSPGAPHVSSGFEAWNPRTASEAGHEVVRLGLKHKGFL